MKGVIKREIMNNEENVEWYINDKKKELKECGKATKHLCILEDIEKTYRRSKLNRGEGYIMKGRRRGGGAEGRGAERRR